MYTADKPSYHPALLAAALAALLLGGCDSVGTTWNESSPARGNGPPDVVLAENAHALSEETTGRLSVTADSTGVLPERLVFGDGADLDSVKAGDYIVAGRTERTPLGFVRKVQEKRTNEGRVVLATERAPPLDAYERLVIDTTVALKESSGPEAVKKSQRLNLKENSPFDPNGPIANTISGFCSNSGDSLCAQASIGPTIFSLKIRPEANIEIEKTKERKRVDISVTFGRRSIYGLQLSRSFLEYEKECPEVLINDKPFFALNAGPIPVITFNLDAGFGAKFEVSRTFSYLREFESPEGAGNGRTLGFTYDDGARLINERRGGEASTKEIRNFPSGLVDFVVGDPVLNSDIYGILAVDARLGETVGPRISGEPFGRLQLRDFTPTPITWEVFAGLRAEVEANVEPFGVDVENVDLLTAELQSPIASGELPETSSGDIPPYIRPPSGIEGVSVGAKRKVTWNRIPGDDPEDDGDVSYHVFAFEQQFDADRVEGSETVASNSRIWKVGSTSGTELVDAVSPESDAFNSPLVYRVTSEGESGAGSIGSNSVTLEGGIPSPKNVTVTPESDTVKISWDRVEGAELFAGYMLYRDTEEYSVDKPRRECNNPNVQADCQDDRIRQVVFAKACEEDSGKYDCLIQSSPFVDDESEIENGTRYYYRVAPVVDLGTATTARLEGDASRLLSATPLPDPPDRP